MRAVKEIDSCMVRNPELARLRALRKLEILDSKPDPSIDQITQMAAKIFAAPVALVSMIDKDRQWVKSRVGVDVEQTPRQTAFCSYTVEQGSTLVVPDTLLDARFAGNPFVTGEPHVRFYAGAPILTGSGHAIGSLCVLDTRPRAPLSANEVHVLQSLADMVSALVHAHTSNSKLRNSSKLVQQRHALVAMTTMDGVWEWTPADNTVYFSPLCQRLLGLPETVVTAPPEYWLERVHPEDLPRSRRILIEHIEGQEHTFSLEHRVRHQDGTWRWVKARGLIVRGARGRCEKVIGSFVDVTALRIYDSLTGLPNRSAFIDLLASKLSQTDFQGTGRPAVLMLEIDRFGRVNDRFGTANADLIFRDIAKRLEVAASLPGKDGGVTLARFEGAKFLVLMDAVPDQDAALALGQRLQEAMRPTFQFDGVQIQVSVSLGATLASRHHKPGEVIQNAQIALQESKKAGPGQCLLFTQKMLEENAMRCRLESELRDAIEQQELRAFYQPQFDLKTGSMIGCEALVRWQHPQFGLLPPIAFLPLAEENGLISHIDFWMLKTACEQMARWRRSSQQASRLRVSVNLSSHKFSELKLHHNIANVLEECQLPASALCLEITETVLMRDVEDAVPTLRSLRKTGIGLHIDDFGAGYSSFSQLYELPFDTLKIDRSFLKNVLTDEKARTIVEAILGLGKRLGLSIIAEGVEEAGHCEFLKKLGCDGVQGYFYSRPLEAAEFEKKFIEPLRSIRPRNVETFPNVPLANLAATCNV